MNMQERSDRGAQRERVETPNLRLFDVIFLGLRLTVTLSWVPRRALFGFSLWRCPGKLWWKMWQWETESGH